jgi:hypothetical protein
MADTAPFPHNYGNMILAGLQRKAHIYQGTVDAGVVQKRRADNRVARRSRRINRRIR